MKIQSTVAVTLAALLTAISSAEAASGAWTNRTPTELAAYTPRAWVDLIFDPVAGRPVLFGGSGEYYFNDIRQIDFAGSRWVEIEPYVPNAPPLGPPTGRDEHAVEYDSFNRLYWSFGGSGYAFGIIPGTMVAGSTTTKIVDPALTSTVVNFYRDWVANIPGPNAVSAFVTAYDPATKTLTLATPSENNAPGVAYSLRPQGGGGTWYYDPARHTWRGLEAPSFGYTGALPRSRLSPAMAFSSRDNAMVMFGGDSFSDTWLLDVRTKTWVPMLADSDPASPARRAQVTNSMAYDPVNDLFVLFGGRCTEPDGGCLNTGANYGEELGDTWVYKLSTNTWTRRFPATAPSRRSQHTLTYDPVNRIMVLIGGSTINGLANDVWAYDVVANTWTQIPAAGGPTPRNLHATVYDPVAGEHVLFGGDVAGFVTVGDVWTLRITGGTVSNSPPIASFFVTPGSGSTTTGFAMNGTASHDPDGTIASYAWTFGDGATATGATASHVYAAPGTYTVRLTVTDNLGATGTTTTSVTVTVSNAPPLAALAIAPPAGDTSTTFDFNGSASRDSDGSVVLYAWDFGDGTTDSGVTASHRYAAAGTFSVRLTVTDNLGATGSASATVTVAAANVAPTAAFVVTPPSGNVATTFGFNGATSADPDGSIASYAWTFGDGATASGVTATHKYAVPGNYSARLVVTDNRGATASKTRTVSVTSANVAPTAAFSVSPLSGTTTTVFGFDGSSSSDPDGSVVAYAWDFGDGTSFSGVSAAHVFTTEGTFVVRLTVTDNQGAIGTVTKQVAVTIANVAPTASFTRSPASGDTTVPFAFDGSGSSDPDGTIASYAWNFGDGATATGATSSHRYSAVGTYTARLTVTDNKGATGTTTATVTVAVAAAANVGPVARIVATQTAPGTFTLSGATSSDADGTITAYAWSFGDTTSGTGAAVSHKFPAPGYYTVSLTVTDSRGATSTTQAVVHSDKVRRKDAPVAAGADAAASNAVLPPAPGNAF